MAETKKAGKGQSNKQRIIEAANDLFYHQGFNQTSFTEIAEAADFPRGNFYYYFRSKEELLKEVILFRCEVMRNMLKSWDEVTADPCARLQSLPTMLEQSREDIVRYGCPLGTLTAELGKTQISLKDVAMEMFNIIIDWCEIQLQAIGFGEQSRQLAQHLMARVQGITTIAYAYQDMDYANFEVEKFRAEVHDLCRMEKE
jgi:AcrR family transcriptional regulator